MRIDDELRRCISEEILLHPVSDVPNSVMLMKTVLEVNRREAQEGKKVFSGDVAGLSSELETAIGTADHLVFILIDGLGMNIFDRLPDWSFMRTSLRSELRSVYPSATSAALVSMASASWPCDHAVTGWHTYLPGRNVTATVLPFLERISKKPLAEYFTGPADVFNVESRIGGIPREVRAYLPERLESGIFSEWFFRSAARFAYRNILEAFRMIGLRLDDAAASNGRTFSYLYVPVLDSAEHHFGPQHDGVLLELLGIDGLLRDFSKKTAGRAVTIVTSDHGLIFVPKERQYDLSDNSAITGLLEQPPSGEARNPVFHVVPGKETSFRASFTEFTEGNFLLITPDEAEELRLFGPGHLSNEMRGRLGTFIGVATTPSAVLWFPPGARRYSHLGFHGGLSSEEMRIPLVLF